MQHLNRFSKEIIKPLIAHLSSLQISYPHGSASRKSLCLQTADLMVEIAKRIGRQMSQQHLKELIQDFFKNFGANEGEATSGSGQQEDMECEEIGPDGSSGEMECGTNGEAAEVHHTNDDANVWLSSALNDENRDARLQQRSSPQQRRQRRRTTSNLPAEELVARRQQVADAFCAETAHHAYVPFARVMGGIYLSNMLGDCHDRVYQMYSQHEMQHGSSSSPSTTPSHTTTNRSFSTEDWSHDPQQALVETVPNQPQHDDEMVRIVGNRIMMRDPTTPTQPDSINEEAEFTPSTSPSSRDEFGLGNESSHLKSNWLAYWEHGIGLPDTDKNIHFNQIYLTTLAGHSSGIKSVTVAEAEDWAMTGSRDRTVRIWNLNHSSGTDQQEAIQSSYVYRQHKKTVYETAFVKSTSTVVSCDGNLHVWDPYTGKSISNVDTAECKSNIVSVVALPAPSRCVAVAFADSNVRILDVRMKNFSQEFKTVHSSTSLGTVKCMCTSSDWFICGFTSGSASLVDIRKSRNIHTWRPHETDMLACSVSPNNSTQLITTSLDQTMKLWDTTYGNLLMTYRSFNDSVSCFDCHENEVISTLSNNRLMVHALPPSGHNPTAVVSQSLRGVLDQPKLNTKIRSDLLRGNITSICLLPLKRQLLVANDAGVVKLFA